MNMCEIIAKKRDGFELSDKEIPFFVNGVTDGTIPDYQTSALLMAIYINGMTSKETAILTLCMARSGGMLDLSSIEGVVVDKHSTGGVGDKVTLILAPLVASAGVKVAKMSGRSLGHTGGTIDKLESFCGIRTDISSEEFINNINEIGISLIQQTSEIAPADKKIYALRDVTATVNSIPLIASSIMSKKIAAGAQAIVLDVKVGRGALVKTLEEAEELAQCMINIGKELGRKVVAVISSMEDPLGCAVGNNREVIEAIQTLNGMGPKDLVELCLVLGSHMLVLGGKSTNLDEAREKLEELLQSGHALEKLVELVKRQGGDISCAYDTKLFPRAQHRRIIYAENNGYINSIDSLKVGQVVKQLGAGRENQDSQIDLSVGVELYRKTGDYVVESEAIARIHANDEEKLNQAMKELSEAIVISGDRPEEHSLVLKILE